MRQGDHGKEGKDAAWVTIVPAVLAASTMVIGCFITFLVMNLDALSPKVGDMVVFRPDRRDQDVWQLKVAAYPPIANGRDSCILDPAVMTRQGGSLVVEARNDTSSEAGYRLRWAGAHTANGVGDCAGVADLAVSRTDLQKLANATGGFGVERGRLIR